MKKIVILAIVLAMSSAASATLTFNFVATDRSPAAGLQVYTGDVVGLQVVASADQMDNVGLYIAINGPATASMVNMTNFINPGNVWDFSGATLDKYLFNADFCTGIEYREMVSYYGVVNGVVVSGITMTAGAAPGSFNLVAFDPADLHTGGLVVYDNQTVQIIPEPMTLGLLAIGGVAVLRRRREAEVKS